MGKFYSIDDNIARIFNILCVQYPNYKNTYLTNIRPKQLSYLAELKTYLSTIPYLNEYASKIETWVAIDAKKFFKDGGDIGEQSEIEFLAFGAEIILLTLTTLLYTVFSKIHLFELGNPHNIFYVNQIWKWGEYNVMIDIGKISDTLAESEIIAMAIQPDLEVYLNTNNLKLAPPEFRIIPFDANIANDLLLANNFMKLYKILVKNYK